MRNKPILALALALLVQLTVSAQVISKDSINDLKQQKEAIKIHKRLNEHKLELAKLENSAAEKNRDIQSSEQEARAAATQNSDIANQLNNHPQDKDLAKQAEKMAKEANKHVKQAEKNNKQLEKINKKIQDIRNKILDDEGKLGKFAPLPVSPAPPPPLPEPPVLPVAPAPGT